MKRLIELLKKTVHRKAVTRKAPISRSWRDLDAHLPSGGSTGRWNDDEPNWNAKE